MLNHSIGGRRIVWTVCLLLAAAMYGNFYVYDAIGPLADLLQRQRGFSDTQIGMLNAIYNKMVIAIRQRFIWLSAAVRRTSAGHDRPRPTSPSDRFGRQETFGQLGHLPESSHAIIESGR